MQRRKVFGDLKKLLEKVLRRLREYSTLQMKCLAEGPKVGEGKKDQAESGWKKEWENRGQRQTSCWSVHLSG